MYKKEACESSDSESDCYLDYDITDMYDRNKCHWTHLVHLPDFISLAKALCVHGVFDLGLKLKSLSCFCPFEKRFEMFFNKNKLVDTI